MIKFCCALLMVVGLLAAAPAASAGDKLRLKPLPNVSVGRVEGTRAFIAFSLERGRLRAYICDGTTKRPATTTTWFKGPWDGRSSPLKLTGAGAELVIDAVSADGRMSGSVVIAGVRHAFSAEPATGPAGLYDGTGRGARATWIVLADGARRGVIVCQTKAKKVYRVVTVTLSDGTRVQQVVYYEVPSC